MLKSHPESAELAYVRARLAISYSLLGATGSAIELAQETQAQLADMDIQDSAFDTLINEWDAMLQVEAVKAAASDMSATAYQAWKATKNHYFPTHLSIPEGHEALKSSWQSMFNLGSEKIRRFLIANAIETNHIESTFLITMGVSSVLLKLHLLTTMKSMQDLICHGVAQGVIEVHQRSEIKEEDVIKNILNDTLAVSLNILSGSSSPSIYYFRRTTSSLLS
ncbi:hypothetical protein C8F04DRAFT_540870 [Mycena alexandri]|uniref:Uncharacterized protein n=1 Tax=Mycena alexandri TaxID=1745969 RepID=A0AAD6SW67_9AGAR|nr:hypothetical protein C8F04DRAFT_540870 [Mycena alexandri]